MSAPLPQSATPRNRAYQQSLFEAATPSNTYEITVGDYSAFLTIGKAVIRAVAPGRQEGNEAKARARLEAYTQNVANILAAIQSAGQDPRNYYISIRGPASGVPEKMEALDEGEEISSHYESLVEEYRRLHNVLSRFGGFKVEHLNDDRRRNAYELSKALADLRQKAEGR